MTGLPYYRSVADLPRALPIFPLPGVLLLPRGTLPLKLTPAPLSQTPLP